MMSPVAELQFSVGSEVISCGHGTTDVVVLIVIEPGCSGPGLWRSQVVYRVWKGTGVLQGVGEASSLGLVIHDTSLLRATLSHP